MPGPGSSYHLGFVTEGAHVLGFMAYFSFSHHFPEGGHLIGLVFTHNSDLLDVFSYVTSMSIFFMLCLLTIPVYIYFLLKKTQQHYEILNNFSVQVTGLCSQLPSAAVSCLSYSPLMMRS